MNAIMKGPGSLPTDRVVIRYQPAGTPSWYLAPQKGWTKDRAEAHVYTRANAEAWIAQCGAESVTSIEPEEDETEFEAWTATPAGSMALCAAKQAVNFTEATVALKAAFAAGQRSRA